MRTAAFALALLALAAPALAQSPPAQSPPAQSCRDLPEFAALNFWLGDWDVYAGGTLDGRDLVQAVLDGCALNELWTDQNHSHGQSLFFYSVFDGRWTQIWITDRSTTRGGLKEKTLVARGSDGSVRFAGLLPGPPGSVPILDRTTLTPLEGGRVHQVIEHSFDGGTTWKLSYDAIYVKHGSPAPR